MLTTSPPVIVPTLQLDDLARDLLDRTDAVGAIVAGMRRLAGHVEPHEDAALAAGDDAAVRPARLGVEHGAAAPRLTLDPRRRRRRADLLVGSEQADQRAGRAEFGEGRQDERVDREARLHVAAARAGAAAVGDAERPPR